MEEENTLPESFLKWISYAREGDQIQRNRGVQKIDKLL